MHGGRKLLRNVPLWHTSIMAALKSVSQMLFFPLIFFFCLSSQMFLFCIDIHNDGQIGADLIFYQSCLDSSHFLLG